MSDVAAETVPVGGTCDSRFDAVRAAFEKNMNGGEELGAAVSVVLDGETVVDLWGGYKDPARTHPWERDTITTMMSVGKAIGALCVLVLADRGKIDLDSPIAAYWPEFAQAGKEAITVRTYLSNLAGMPIAEAAPAGSMYEAGVLERALEVQAPMWEPGTQPCYHSFTMGPMCRELVKRVSGKDIGPFLREEITDPLGVDYHFGLTPEEEARCATYVETPGTPSLEGIKRTPDSILGRAWKPLPKDEDFNSGNYRRAQLPSANGHGNARAIARLYGCLARGGELGGVRIMSEAAIEDAIAEQWDAVEVMTNRPFRFGTGFMLNNVPFNIGPNPRAFGHPGVGGAIGFADPDATLGFSYCGNRMAPVADRGPFAGALIDAAYASL